METTVTVILFAIARNDKLFRIEYQFFMNQDGFKGRWNYDDFSFDENVHIGQWIINHPEDMEAMIVHSMKHQKH